jgi:hypothetical protein
MVTNYLEYIFAGCLLACFMTVSLPCTANRHQVAAAYQNEDNTQCESMCDALSQ